MPIEILYVLDTEELSDQATQHLVPMRDGVHLATDVYLPAGDGPFPVALVRTCYDKASDYTALKYQAPMFTERGYAFVAQDVRGKYRSEGDTIPYEFDVQDGYDTIEWIVGQNWAKPTVGAFGQSYYGFTVWAAVASRHPALKAASPGVTGVDMAAMHVGSPPDRDIPNLIGINDLVQVWTDRRAYLLSIDYSEFSPVAAVADGLEKVVGRNLSLDRLLGRARTGEIYSPYRGAHPYDVTEIPILHRVAFFDPGLAPLGLADWRHFRNSSSLRDNHFLQIASADHAGFPLSEINSPRYPYTDIELRGANLMKESADIIEFFDAFVRETSDGASIPRVRWELGHGTWREAEEWPPPGMQMRTLHLHPGSELPGQGALLDAVAPAETAVEWTHDPGDPVPSPTSIEEVWYFLAVSPDTRTQDERPDVITFTSPPLTEDCDIAGQPAFSAHVSSDGPSMHLFVTLEDVTPEGPVRVLSQGRAIVANPDRTPVTITLGDVGYRFAAGHRIRISIASSNFPYFLVHPGTGENPWYATDYQTNAQTLHVGGPAEAHLRIPVLSG